jgi:hypothetical protein
MALSLAIACVVTMAHAAAPPPALAKGTLVRLEGIGIEGGWHEARITISSEGCTMATLAKPTKEGYTMLALVAMARLQRQSAGAWQDLPLKDLLTREPKACLEGNG